MGDTKTAKAPAGADEAVAIGPDDEGVGSVRPHVIRVEAARWTCQRT